MNRIILTNNPLVKDKLSDHTIDIELFGVTYIDILKKARDKIHKGHKLLTHPLSGSVKPNETPYKSVVLSKEFSQLDIQSLMIIEGSIHTAEKFESDKKTPNWGKEILEDFQLLDLSLVQGAIDK